MAYVDKKNISAKQNQKIQQTQFQDKDADPVGPKCYKKKKIKRQKETGRLSSNFSQCLQRNTD